MLFSSKALNIVVAVGLPAIVFTAGAVLLPRVSGRNETARVLRRIFDTKTERHHQKPLNERFGYTVSDVDRHWGAIVTEPCAVAGEQSFLKFDLVFPLVYGAALVTSLLMAWAMLGRPFNPAWVMAPVAIAVVSDWTENLIHIAQLRRYVELGTGGLRPGWVHVASVATTIKLVLCIACFLTIVLSAGWLLVRPFLHKA